ncbi:hypothetical protein SAMN06295974_3763 [Plantibacter flavus]|uniref:Uncharacterized protein n=1 Tax=Plantibacter flavus TaxID=150123 RepID=A0A3N2BLF6_9MICO|nr:hypothetical protein [Plantibacter flavus]ROR76089.1 hypothetical protein EDD42_4042 [Plantibacter flavus]SMG48657.1 hypothetical protein SAMN06295974_3763 [Plantibacter flavus]
MSSITSWRLRASDPAEELDLLRADYGHQSLTDRELLAVDLLTQLQHQELHHGPTRLQYSADDQVQMISTDLDVATDVRVDSFPAAGAQYAVEQGFIAEFDGGVTFTAAACDWMNPLRVAAGWLSLRTPVMSLVAVVGGTRHTELRRHVGGFRVISTRPGLPAYEVKYRWLVPDPVVEEALTSGLLALAGTTLSRTELAAQLPDNFRDFALADPSGIDGVADLEQKN